MDHKEVKSLLIKYQSGDCDAAEEALIERWYLQFNEHETDLTDERIEELRLEVLQLLPGKEVINKRNNWRLSVITLAAAVVIVFGVGTLFLKKDSLLPNAYANDIDPGTNKAILTLANGKSINLTDAKDGELASDRGVKVIKEADGQLLFKFNPDTVHAASSKQRDSISSLVSSPIAAKRITGLNSVTTPRGGQYHIALPDGTNVWINAGSILRFPSSFWDMPERRVYLSGEAYFEVAQVKSVFGMQKRARRLPFIVQTDKQEVTVLGTHFNINSYTDEPEIKTTLLEGLVKVSSFRGGNAVLKPDMQAVNNGSALNVIKVDVEEIIAWKNGEFMFRKEALESIMRKIARWYDVEVIYENKQVAKELFGGTISKYDKISKVLSVLESTGDVKFKINGRRVTATK